MLNLLQQFHKESFGGRMQLRQNVSHYQIYRHFNLQWQSKLPRLSSRMNSIEGPIVFIVNKFMQMHKICPNWRFKALRNKRFSVAIGWEKSDGTAQSIIDTVHLHFWLLLWSNIIYYKHEVCNISNLNDYIITKIGLGEVG